MKNKIILSTDDVVRNRKTLTIKLNVWKKIISCAVHEDLTLSKIINKAIDNYIKENNYNIDEIFKNNLAVNYEIHKDDKIREIEYQFNDQY
jgi:macrodomain Ter protein organizer (MatP/YcbG family)